MSTDTDQLVTVGYLQSYDKKIKAAYKAADETLKSKLIEEFSKITSFGTKFAESLPATGEKGFIYFVPKKDDSSSENNVCEEYLWLESTSSFEKIGDTKINIDELKAEIASDCITSVDVTYINGTTANGVTQSSYKLSFKNSKGEEIDSEQINVISAISIATDSNDGLMSKEDKSKLDSLVISTADDVDNWFDNNWPASDADD